MCRELQLTNLLRKWRLPVMVDQRKLQIKHELSSFRHQLDIVLKRGQLGLQRSAVGCQHYPLNLFRRHLRP